MGLQSIINEVTGFFSRWDIQFSLHSPLVWAGAAIVLFGVMVIIVSKAKW